ncbi:MAG: CDP-diacylglycerol diphosphatase [Gallionella sp.]
MSKTGCIGNWPRNQVALAINSAYGRTQNQLHIHVDCVRPDVDRILRQRLSAIGNKWAPLGMHLNNHPYWAMRIVGSTPGNHDPFKLLAEGMPAARNHMDRQTLVLIGASFNDGKEGFILLADHVYPSIGDHASGEELQDHDCEIADQ